MEDGVGHRGVEADIAIRQVTVTPESLSSFRSANEKESRNALLAL
jgi:hypothetical protein